MDYDCNHFEKIMLSLLDTKNEVLCISTQHRLLRSHYGFMPIVIMHIWNLIKKNLPKNARPKHLIWLFAYCKSYLEYDQYCALFQVSIPTFRDWVWLMAKVVSQIEIVSNLILYKKNSTFTKKIIKINFENRFHLDNGSKCKISVDGTDCPIREPSEFSGRWYSHKFRGAGLRYELGVCIQTGHIVWVNGPYPCGSFPDLKIARHKLIHQLLPGEMFVADRGYRDGGVHAMTPTGYNTPGERMKSIVRARHESVNGRLKKFKILSTPFRNKLDKHYMIFYLLTNAVQIEIECCTEMYDVYYNDVEVV
jgi:hypothetical protein